MRPNNSAQSDACYAGAAGFNRYVDGYDMSWLAIIVFGIACTFVLFVVLQFISDRTYKPTKEEIREIIQRSIDGKLDLGAFDDFSNVRIAYNKNLDEIREKYNVIVANKKYFTESEITEENAVALNDKGKHELYKLMAELDGVST